MCSHCGNIHKNLGSNDTYRCIKCEMVMDRDVNGARNIYMKSHEKKIGKKNHLIIASIMMDAWGAQPHYNLHFLV